MRTFDLALQATLLLCAIPALGQQAAAPPAGSNWQHVEVLPTGTTLRVNTKSRHVTCKLKSINVDSLTCLQGFDQSKETLFQRTEITSIRLPHRGRSTLVGLGIGAGGAAAIGLSCGDKAFCIVAGSLTFVPVGAIAGFLTDFTRSTVYKTP